MNFDKKIFRWIPAFFLALGILLADQQGPLAASLSLVAWLMLAFERRREMDLACLVFVAVFGIDAKFGWAVGGGSPLSTTHGLQFAALELGAWILGIAALLRCIRARGFFQTPVIAAAGWTFLILVGAGIGLMNGHHPRSVLIDFRALGWIFSFFVLVELDSKERKFFWNMLAAAIVLRVGRDLVLMALEPGAFYTRFLPWTQPMYHHGESLQFALLALLMALWFVPGMFAAWGPRVRTAVAALLVAMITWSVLRSYWGMAILTVVAVIAARWGKETPGQLRRIFLSAFLGLGVTLAWFQAVSPDFVFFGIQRALTLTHVHPGLKLPAVAPEDLWFRVSPQLKNYIRDGSAKLVRRGMDASISVRRQLFGSAAEKFKENPWAGQGLGGVYSAVISKKARVDYRHPHSAYAWTMGALGIPGLFFNFALLVALGVALFRSRRRTAQGAWNLALALSLMVILSGVFTWNWTHETMAFWTGAAVALALGHLKELTSLAETAPAANKVKSWYARFFALTLGLAAVFPLLKIPLGLLGKSTGSASAGANPYFTEIACLLLLLPALWRLRGRVASSWRNWALIWILTFFIAAGVGLAGQGELRNILSDFRFMFLPIYLALFAALRGSERRFAGWGAAIGMGVTILWNLSMFFNDPLRDLNPSVAFLPVPFFSHNLASMWLWPLAALAVAVGPFVWLRGALAGLFTWVWIWLSYLRTLWFAWPLAMVAGVSALFAAGNRRRAAGLLLTQSLVLFFSLSMVSTYMDTLGPYRASVFYFRVDSMTESLARVFEIKKESKKIETVGRKKWSSKSRDQMVESLSDRRRMISVAKKDFEKNPLIGQGLGHLYDLGQGRWMTNPHNGYWWIASKLGLLGLAVWMWGLVLLLRQWWKYKKTPWAAWVVSGTSLFLLCEWFQPGLGAPSVALPLALVWVLGLPEGAFLRTGK